MNEGHQAIAVLVTFMVFILVAMGTYIATHESFTKRELVNNGWARYSKTTGELILIKKKERKGKLK